MIDQTTLARECRIRPAEQGDFQEIADLTNHYIRTSTIHFAYEETSADLLLAAWQASRARYPFFVAVSDSTNVTPRFLGFAKCGVWRDRDAYQWTPEAGIYVSPAAQRRGIGRVLYTALINECAARGFHSIVAGITLPNQPSIALHRAVGFIEAGRIAHAGFKFGAWHDVAFYQRMLAGPDHLPAPLP